MTDITKIVAEFKAFEAEFQAKAKSTLIEAFKAFFDANPTVQGFGWTQYTPYFNDGDECTFSTNFDEIPVKIGTEPMTMEELQDNRWGGDDAEAGIYMVTHYDDEGHPAEIFAAQKATDAFVREITKLPDDVFQKTFGDHVYVLATRAGFETEQYDHD